MQTQTPGAAPVVGGAFVKDLALELGKAPATLVAYLKKHLPATLTKRKNANNRLANFVTEDGVAGLRAHYTPTVAPNSFFCDELQRLREENARLRAMLTDDLNESIESIEQRYGELNARVEQMLEKREEAALDTAEILKKIDAEAEKYQKFIDDTKPLVNKIERSTNEKRQIRGTSRSLHEPSQGTRGAKSEVGKVVPFAKRRFTNS